PAPRHDPSDEQIQAAKDALANLMAGAANLGKVPAAAGVHHAMGRIFLEQLGDEKSAAVCYQNAFELNPRYRPNLESARRLFAAAGQKDKALALHHREEALLDDDGARAESLRAQAMLLRELGRAEDAKKLIDGALRLAPEHPALLKAGVEASERQGDRARTATLLIRSADATRDPVYKAQLLRRAVLLLDALRGQPEGADTAQLHDEAVRKLHQADPNDAIGFFATLLRARSSNDWETVLRLCRQRADRTAGAADRALAAAIAAYRLGRVSECLAEATAALENNRRDGALLALRSELSEQQKSPALAQRALKLVPKHLPALRLLTRTLPGLMAGDQLADLLEHASVQLPRAIGAELLARAAALVSEAEPERSIALARRAAEMARGLVSPRGLETWCTFAFKLRDFAQLSQALEARADSTSGSDAADLLVEASELARAAGNDVRSTTLLRKARGVDPGSSTARNALLALSTIPSRERIDLLQEEARHTGPSRAAALQAERAMLLEEEGRVDQAVYACTHALTLAGLEL